MKETTELNVSEEATKGAGGKWNAFAAERRRHAAVLVGGVLLVALGALFTWRYYAIRESTDDAQIDGHIHAISAKVGGPVVSVRVLNNDVVEAGAVLAEIDPRDYQVALEHAKANLAAAEALARASEAEARVVSEQATSQLSDAEAGLEEARASLRSAEQQAEAAQARLRLARARLREAQVNSERADKDREKMERLFAEGLIAQQQHDAAVAAAEAMKAAVDAAAAGVTDAEVMVRASENQVAEFRAKVAQAEAAVRAARTAPQQIQNVRARAQSAQAQMEQARAALRQAELNLEYTTIRAPVRGIIAKKVVEVGQLVQPGQPLMAIVSLDDIWVTANFKETQLNSIRPGQAAIVSVDAYGGRKYRGHVDSIAGATGAKFSLLPPENATGNFVKVVQRVPVKIVLEEGQDPDHLLRPGMSVVPTVITR